MEPTWNDTLKIGVPMIDIQHKQLFDQMDLLTEILKRGKTQGQVLKVLEFLDLYVDNHFGYEEQCMYINKCPAASLNKTAHSHFKKRLKQIHTLIDKQSSPDLVAQQIKQELCDWFIKHIQGIDTQLASCIKT